jgi:hypothetical protein
MLVCDSAVKHSLGLFSKFINPHCRGPIIADGLFIPLIQTE